MADRDIENQADAYTGSFPINPVDADAFDPLAYDTADLYYACETCRDTRMVPHPTLPYTRAVPCPDCGDIYCPTHDLFNCPYAHGGAA